MKINTSYYLFLIVLLICSYQGSGQRKLLRGENWINELRSNDIPGLNEAIDLGLAAGAPDKKQYWVEFKDWEIKVAK